MSRVSGLSEEPVGVGILSVQHGFHDARHVIIHHRTCVSQLVVGRVVEKLEEGLFPLSFLRRWRRRWLN